jgi:hypothetical protein
MYTNRRRVAIMKDILYRLLDASRKFSLWDFGFLKIALFSAGILFGAYLSKFILSLTSLLWIIFIVSYVWVLYKTIKYIK